MSKPAPSEDFLFWVRYGFQHGYLSAPFCWEHGAPPMSEDEEIAMDTVEPVCITTVRLYPQ